jgi:hypothetical protein
MPFGIWHSIGARHALLQAAFVRLNVYRHCLWLDGSTCCIQNSKKERELGVVFSKKRTEVGRSCILQIIKNGTFVWKSRIRAFSNHNALDVFRRDLAKIIQKPFSNQVFPPKKFSEIVFFR